MSHWTYRRLFKPLLAAGLLVAAVASASAQAKADELRVAVAANFSDAAKEIGALFEAESGYRPLFSFGATGQLYTQIAQGAPFDVFLAADQARPERAVAEGFAVADSRFTYARGRLALFSQDEGRITSEAVLRDGTFAKLAIANPLTAPYGAAAVEALQALGLREALRSKLVQGNNASQTFQFVATGNAEVGFVALSQLVVHEGGSHWVVPSVLHGPIAQDAVLLTAGKDNETARAFLDFLKSDAARAVLARYGYES